MIAVHVLFYAHVGVPLGYRQSTRVFLMIGNCYRGAEKLYEDPVKCAPGGITWVSFDLLVITADEAQHCLMNPLLPPVFLTNPLRSFKTYREAFVNNQTTFTDNRVLDNLGAIFVGDDEMTHVYILAVPLWVNTPRISSISHAPTWRLTVHVFNGIKEDYRKLTLSVNTNDTYGAFIERLYLQLIDGLSMSRWTGHVGNAGMIEFHSRPGLFLIPSDVMNEDDLNIINLLTSGIYCIDLWKVLHSVLWSGVRRYIPIKDVLKNTANVELVACFSGDPRNDYRANPDYRNHMATAFYWADVDYNKLKLILGEYLRTRIRTLLEIDQSAIPHGQFVHVPGRNRDVDGYMPDDVIELLKRKCSEELLVREKFNHS